MTILELTTDLDLPTSGVAWHNLREGRLPAHMMSHVSADLQHVIELMMCPRYQERPSAADLLQLDCIQSVKRKRQWMILYYQMVCLVPEVLVWN